VTLFRSVCQPHYIAKKEMTAINEQTTTKVKYPKFSEFVKKISALKIWGDLSSYKEAFGFTDYLQIRIAGSGYRVWLLNSK